VLIDCETCVVRDVACADCVVTVLLDRPESQAPVVLEDEESAAIGVLAESGLVPPLRLVPATYDERRAGGAARAG